MQDDIFNSFDIDETIADYIHSCDLKKLQQLKEFIEQVEEGKLNCFLIENRKKWGYVLKNKSRQIIERMKETNK